ncbi:hypothetical protein LTR97_000484 [Elasticomyces elasticus]|uniref:Cytochrome b561 domain-containing protein n=1 Tax=Elasticomyces elasticus TaxID=574655 RepID=A0AAN8A5J0_9PEZI|nr:hypothetical protein LTR97_000484 [Elasticomyces elasticus]
MKTALLVAASLSLGATVHAAVSNTCPETDVCYGLAIPDATASSGTGDIYFQLSAPTTYQWIALGQGSSMSGSNIFIMYPSGDGNNVTVSPRLGTGHRQPQYNANARITLLEGSGIQDGVMTANVRCSSCNSWSGGSMDFSGSASRWIHAYRTGSALNSDDPAENLQQHNQAYPFSWDLSQARVTADGNPFVSSASNAPDSTPTTASAGSSGTSAIGNPNSGSGSNLGGGASPIDGVSQRQRQQERVQTAHAICASIAFVGLFPIGAIIVRVAGFKNLVWVHVATQTIALAVFIAAVGLGLYIATSGNQLNEAHPIIGLVLFVVLFFQPIFGWMHHRLFKKHGGRTAWSYAHLTVGRGAIVLGMINGGLGLQLAYANSSAKIAYGVVAGVVSATYLASIIFGEVKRKQNTRGYGANEKERARLDCEDSDSTGERVVVDRA